MATEHLTPNAKNQRRWRQRNADEYRALSRAAAKARFRLVELHREEYHDLLDEERAKEGLGPSHRRPGRPAKEMR